MIVADGFVGNVVLKTGEGMVAEMGKVIKDTLLGGNSSPNSAPRCSLPALRGLRRKFDYETYGGAPLLGLARKLHRDARARQPQCDQARDPRGG